jgi:hypothetical protein
MFRKLNILTNLLFSLAFDLSVPEHLCGSLQYLDMWLKTSVYLLAT